jgi:hypothetical protein
MLLLLLLVTVVLLLLLLWAATCFLDCDQPAATTCSFCRCLPCARPLPPGLLLLLLRVMAPGVGLGALLGGRAAALPVMVLLL